MRRVYEGEIIEIEEKQFSKRWMEKLDETSLVKKSKTKKEEKKEQVSEESLDVI